MTNREQSLSFYAKKIVNFEPGSFFNFLNIFDEMQTMTIMLQMFITCDWSVRGLAKFWSLVE